MSNEASNDHLFFETPMGPATRNKEGNFSVAQEHLEKWFEEDKGIPYDTVKKVHEAELDGCMQLAKFLTPHVCAENRPLEITVGRGTGNLQARVIDRYIYRGKSNQGEPEERFGRVKIGVGLRIPEKERREGGTVHEISKSIREALDTGTKTADVKKEATA